MTHKLDVELEFVTDLLPVELASKVAPLVREALETMRQSFGAELEFDIFLVLMGVRCVLPWSRCEIRSFVCNFFVFVIHS